MDILSNRCYPNQTTMQTPEFKTLFCSVRPARVAVFIDSSDPDWHDTCLRIIEFFSRLWGGKYGLIVPTDGNTIPDPFFNVLEAFDPDYLYSYQKTLADLKLSSPQKYNEILERETNKWLTAHPAADRQGVLAEIDRQLQIATVSGFDVSPNLQNRLKEHLAPFHFKNHIVKGRLYAGSLPSFPLTDVTKLLPNSEHQSGVGSVTVSIQGIPPVWYASTTGLINFDFEKALHDTQIFPAEVRFTENDRTALVDLVVKHEASSMQGLPFEISSIGLGYYASRDHQDWLEPIVVVCGETLSDFCLYYCLSRLRHNVSWLLPSWLKTFKEAETTASSGGPRIVPSELLAFHFAHAITDIARNASRDAKVVFVSSSLNRTKLEECRDTLDQALFMTPGALRNSAEIPESIGDLLRFPLILYERDNVGRDVTKAVIDNELAGLFETPKPKSFRKIDPAEHRWISEIVFRDHWLPRHHALGPWVISDSRLSTWGARSGLNGLAYLCPNIGYFGGDIDTVLIKPRVYVPGAFEIFNKLAGEAGLACRPSDKGLFAQETIEKFGGLDKVAGFLRDEPRRSVLDKFLDQSRPDAGIQDEGVFLSSDRRRYLNLPSIGKIVGGTAEAGQLADELTSLRVLHRGFIFKCKFCKNADWFEVGEITHEFKCKRCGRPQFYTREHWRAPEEPQWFYKLDEIVYQAHSHNMMVPLLALDCLRRKTEGSFLYSPELEFLENGGTKPIGEVDICCIPRGMICLGEAKKENRLGATTAEEQKAINKYRDIAGKVGARRLVFATLATSWAETTRQQILDALGNSIEVAFLEGNDLLQA